MTQLALEFERPAEEGPVVTKSDVETVIANLRGRDWQTARQLRFETESDKRVLRAIAEASGFRILSGQKGYKLTVEATPEDMQQFVWLKNQAKKNLRRFVGTQRLWIREGICHRHPQP